MISAMLKKTILLFLSIIMVVSICACSDEETKKKDSNENADTTTSIHDEEASREPQKLNILMCKNEHISVMLDHVENGKIYVSATNLTDEDIRLDINYIDVDGVMYTNTFEGEMIYSGKTQVYALAIYNRDTGEKVKYNCKMGSKIDGQFEYFSSEYTYCEDINFGPLTVEQ